MSEAHQRLSKFGMRLLMLFAPLLLLLPSTGAAAVCEQPAIRERQLLTEVNAEHRIVRAGEVYWSVAPDAELFNAAGETVELSYFQPGKSVNVRFCPAPVAGPEEHIGPSGGMNGFLGVATRIRETQGPAATPTPTRTPVTGVVEGAVTSINREEQRFLIGNQSAGAIPISVSVSNETVFVTEDRQVLTFADLRVNHRVRVTGEWRQPEVSIPEVRYFAAKKVVIINGLPDHYEGTIRNIREDLTGFGASASGPEVDMNVVFTSETLIKDKEGNVLSPAALAVDQRVHVIGRFIPTLIAPSMIEAAQVVILGQVTPPAEIEFTGRIGSINAQNKSFVAAGRVVYTNSETEIVDAEGEVLEFAALKISDQVQVKGRPVNVTASAAILPPHMLPVLASSIKVLESTVPTEPVEFDGTIEEIMWRQSSFLAGGHVVAVNNSTTIKNAQGQRIALRDLRVDMKVHVVGRQIDREDLRSENGTASYVLASLVQVLAQEEPPVTVEGRINEIAPLPHRSAIMIRIADTRMLITEKTRIEDVDGSEIPVRALRVGDRAAARAVHSEEENHLIAVHVRLLRNIEPPIERVEFRGVVESVFVDRNQLVVNGTLVRTTTETVILDQDENPIALGDIEAGSFVHVAGVRNGEHAVIATRIRLLEDPTHDRDEIEFRGNIAEIDIDASSLVVAGRFVIVTSDTLVIDIDNKAVTLAELSVGQLVEVEGFVTRFAETDGPPAVTATRIEVERTGCIEQHISGDLTQLDGAEWKVGERTVLITENTTFSDREGNRLSADDFEAGDRVSVKGCAVPGQPLAARHVVLLPSQEPEPHCRPSQAFAGEVTAVDLDTSTVVINDKSIRVAEFTRITREGVGQIGLADVEVGAHAFAELMPAATMPVACFIRIAGEVPPPPPDEFHRVVGRIAAINSPTLTLIVQDQTIQVGEATRIISRRGEEIAFGDLRLGQMIDARGRLDADETLLAAVIKVQEENHVPGPPPAVAGLVTGLNLPGSITVGENRISLTNETTFVGYNEQPIQATELQVGDWVRVVLAPSATTIVPPELVARRVVLRAAVLQAIDIENSLITVSGDPVAVTANTQIREVDGTGITLSDLAVGDLVRVRLSLLTIHPPQATHIIRFRAVNFSGPIEGYSGTEHGIEDGEPTLTSHEPGNTFGFISLPFGMSDALANKLFEVRMRVATNVTERSRVPSLRLRLNMANWEKGTTYEVDSRGQSQFVPTAEGREYVAYFVPTAEHHSLSDFARQFFASLDLLSFDPRLADDAKLKLRGIRVRPIDIENVNVVRTLAQDDLADAPGNWQYGSAPATYTSALYGAEPGAISLAPNGAASFGYWTLRTGVTAEAGKIFRARFLVRTNTANPQTVPPFRLRLNTSRFELSSTTMIYPSDKMLEVPGTEARVYDVYLPVPADGLSNETILASIDLIAFGQTIDPNSTITLEQFLLEEVEIAE